MRGKEEWRSHLTIRNCQRAVCRIGSEVLVKKILGETMSIKRLGALLAWPLLIATGAVFAAEDNQKDGKTEVIILPEDTPEAVPLDPSPYAITDIKHSFGGYIKINGIFSHYSDGDVATPSGGRDFFRPNSIPVAPDSDSEQSFSHFDSHAKDSRFWLLSSAKMGDWDINTRFELDFRSSAQGNEVVSNSYSPRLRRAFVSFGDWLVGQEWTLFRNHAGNPESLESLGATDGLIFGRQPQVRYTAGPWQFSLENSETFLLTFGGSSRQVTGDTLVPDLHLRRNFGGRFSDFSVSAVLRHLAAEDFATGLDGEAAVVDDATLGYGLSFAGRFKVGRRDDVRFMLSGGEGIGRYLAIATSADVVSDGQGGLEPIFVTNGVLAYRHLWSNRLRSTVAVSGLLADNDPNLTGTSLTKSVRSLRANLIYEPAKKFLVGIEVLQAVRELENGESGNHTRPQVSLKYSF